MPMSMQVPLPTPLEPSRFLQRLIRFLIPFFIDVCPDLDTAREEILETLASYGARTRSELLNAAQIIAYGLSALDTLHEAKATEMSPSLRLRYRGCANNLNRSGQQNEQILAKRLASDTPEVDPTPVEPVDDHMDAEFREKIMQAHAKLAACGIHMPAPFPAAIPHQIPATDPARSGPPWGSTVMQATAGPTTQPVP